MNKRSVCATIISMVAFLGVTACGPSSSIIPPTDDNSPQVSDAGPPMKDAAPDAPVIVVKDAAPDSPTTVKDSGPMEDSPTTVIPDSGEDCDTHEDSGEPDSGSAPDSGVVPDSGTTPDSGTVPDSGTHQDGGVICDAAPPPPTCRQVCTNTYNTCVVQCNSSGGCAADKAACVFACQCAETSCLNACPCDGQEPPPDNNCGKGETLLCHYPLGSSKHNICVPTSEVNDHCGHGDQVGDCNSCSP
jgi:hypothetical protein